MKIAVFISGTGSNLKNLIDEKFEISCVFCNNPDASGLNYAKEANIPTHILSDKYIPKIKGDSQTMNTYNQIIPHLSTITKMSAGGMTLDKILEDKFKHLLVHKNLILKLLEIQQKRCEYDAEITKILKPYKPDLIVLAGYMRILSPEFIQAWKIINIHPSLLPAFKGANAIQEAYKFGVKIMGATVHYVSENIDEGAIIDQESFRREDTDTLQDLTLKLRQAERALYPRALRKVAKISLDL